MIILPQLHSTFSSGDELKFQALFAAGNTSSNIGPTPIYSRASEGTYFHNRMEARYVYNGTPVTVLLDQDTLVTASPINAGPVPSSSVRKRMSWAGLSAAYPNDITRVVFETYDPTASYFNLEYVWRIYHGTDPNPVAESSKTLSYLPAATDTLQWAPESAQVTNSSTGAILRAQTNEPRFQGGVSHSINSNQEIVSEIRPQGILVEPARENFVQWSSPTYADLTRPAWATRSAASTESTRWARPDGTTITTALSMSGPGHTSEPAIVITTLPGTDSNKTLAVDTMTAVPNGTHTFSFFLKPHEANDDEWRWLRVRFANANSPNNNITAWVSINSADVTAYTTVEGIAESNGSLATEASIVTYAYNDWIRVAVTGSLGGSASESTDIRLSISSVDNNGSNLPDPAGVSYLFWGAQYEVGAYASSYIPTRETTATRSADFLSISNTDFPTVFNPANYTVACKFTEPKTKSVSHTPTYLSIETAPVQDITNIVGRVFKTRLVPGAAHLNTNCLESWAPTPVPPPVVDINEPNSPFRDETPIACWATETRSAYRGSKFIALMAVHGCGQERGNDGIERVEFIANNGAITTVYEAEYGPNGVHEWGTALQQHATDGPIEIRAIIYPYVGKCLVLQGGFDLYTQSGHTGPNISYNPNVENENSSSDEFPCSGEPIPSVGSQLIPNREMDRNTSLIAWSNGLGSYTRPSRYVSLTGNDDTGTGTLTSPYRTIQKALLADSGSLDFVNIYLGSGTHQYARQTPLNAAAYTNSKSWVTIQPASGASNVVIGGNTSGITVYSREKFIRFRNIIFDYTTDAAPTIIGDPDAMRPRIWFDSCIIRGPGTSSGNLGFSHYFRNIDFVAITGRQIPFIGVRRAEWLNWNEGPTGASIASTILVNNISGDVFTNVRYIRNFRVIDMKKDANLPVPVLFNRKIDAYNNVHRRDSRIMMDGTVSQSMDGLVLAATSSVANEPAALYNQAIVNVVINLPGHRSDCLIDRPFRNILFWHVDLQTQNFKYDNQILASDTFFRPGQTALPLSKTLGVFGCIMPGILSQNTTASSVWDAYGITPIPVVSRSQAGIQSFVSSSFSFDSNQFSGPLAYGLNAIQQDCNIDCSIGNIVPTAASQLSKMTIGWDLNQKTRDTGSIISNTSGAFNTTIEIPIAATGTEYIQLQRVTKEEVGSRPAGLHLNIRQYGTTETLNFQGANLWPDFGLEYDTDNVYGYNNYRPLCGTTNVAFTNSDNNIKIAVNSSQLGDQHGYNYQRSAISTKNILKFNHGTFDSIKIYGSVANDSRLSNLSVLSANDDYQCYAPQKRVVPSLPSLFPTPTLTATTTMTPSITPSITPSHTATPSYSRTPLPTLSATRTPTPTATRTADPTSTPLPTRSTTPTATCTPTVTRTPSGTPTRTPSGTPTRTPSGTPLPTVPAAFQLGWAQPRSASLLYLNEIGDKIVSTSGTLLAARRFGNAEHVIVNGVTFVGSEQANGQGRPVTLSNAISYEPSSLVSAEAIDLYSSRVELQDQEVYQSIDGLTIGKLYMFQLFAGDESPEDRVLVSGTAAQGDTLTLTAPFGKIFSSVVFASYGTPTAGESGEYVLGPCHASNSTAVVASRISSAISGSQIASSSMVVSGAGLAEVNGTYIYNGLVLLGGNYTKQWKLDNGWPSIPTAPKATISFVGSVGSWSIYYNDVPKYISAVVKYTDRPNPEAATYIAYGGSANPAPTVVGGPSPATTISILAADHIFEAGAAANCPATGKKLSVTLACMPAPPWSSTPYEYIKRYQNTTVLGKSSGTISLQRAFSRKFYFRAESTSVPISFIRADTQGNGSSLPGGLTGQIQAYQVREVAYNDPAVTPTPTPTVSLTASRTPSLTPSQTRTPSGTPTVTPTVTRTPSGTPTRTPSGTPTPTRTRTPLPTVPATVTLGWADAIHYPDEEGDTIVSNNGRLVVARRFGNVSEVNVNGVIFTGSLQAPMSYPSSIPGAPDNIVNVGIPGTIGQDFFLNRGNMGVTAVALYSSRVNGIQREDSRYGIPYPYSICNLTIGKVYMFQIFGGDSRPENIGRLHVIKLWNGLDNSPIYSSGKIYGDWPFSKKAYFRAETTCMFISFGGDEASTGQLCAYQLREIESSDPPPSPTPTPSFTPTVSYSRTPTVTPTIPLTPSHTATSTATPTTTLSMYASPTPTLSLTPSITPTPTNYPTYGPGEEYEMDPTDLEWVGYAEYRQPEPEF